MIYVKLSYKNIIKMFKEYSIYFITITFCAGFFYSFNSLSNDTEVVNLVPSVKLMYIQLEGISFIVSFTIIFLVIYINNFIIKKRTKEFAIYTILGMNQKIISLLFFIENAIIGMLSVMLGCLLGILISFSLRGLIINSFELRIMNKVMFNFNTFTKTIIFYLVIFIVVGLVNMYRINKLKIIDLLLNHRKNEELKIKNKIIQLAIFILSIGMCIYAFSSIYEYLGNYSQVKGETHSIDQIIIFVSYAIGTYGLFYSISSIFSLFKMKFKKYTQKKINLFFISELISKINTKTKVITTLSLVILISLISFSVGFIMSTWGENFKDRVTVYDIEIETEYNDIIDESLSLEIDFSEVHEYIEKIGDTQDSKGYNLFFIKESDFHRRKRIDFPPLLMKLSDYNDIRKINGYEKIELRSNEFAIHYKELDISAKEIKNLHFVEKGLSINENQMMLKEAHLFNETFGNSITNDYVGYTIIVQDDLTNHLKVAKSAYVVDLVDELTIKESDNLTEFLVSWYMQNYPEHLANDSQPIDIKTKVEQEVSSKISVMVVKLTGLLIGAILLIMCLTVLTIQQLVDSVENKYKYDILHKLGVDGGDINAVIVKQVLIQMNLPFIWATIGFLIFLYSFFKGFGREINAFFSDGSFLLSGFGLPILIFLCIYLTYFMFTITIYINNVKFNREL